MVLLWNGKTLEFSIKNGLAISNLIIVNLEQYIYGLIKTRKENNPIRVITSGCSTAIKYLSIFVEKYLYKKVNKIDSRIKDTQDMLKIIDMVNGSNILTKDSVLVSFDIVNMFLSISNVSGLKAVSEILENRETNFHRLNVF